MKTRYLTYEEVVKLQRWTVLLTGGSVGVRDVALLEAALARPRAGYGQFEAYPDIFAKAAALLHSLIKNHPFHDGNKRTALVVAGVFLERNGYKLRAGNEDLVDFTLAIATDQLSDLAIRDWLKVHSQKI